MPALLRDDGIAPGSATGGRDVVGAVHSMAKSVPATTEIGSLTNSLRW
ncbi:MAG: hypothetical protein R3C49_25785 [Planctomycetaceae bacterium]